MAYSITDDCTGCNACVSRCPVEAISGEKDQKHSIDEDICIGCGDCGRICPEGAVLDEKGNVCIPINLPIKH